MQFSVLAKFAIVSAAAAQIGTVFGSPASLEARATCIAQPCGGSFGDCCDDTTCTPLVPGILSVCLPTTCAIVGCSVTDPDSCSSCGTDFTCSSVLGLATACLPTV
ncbi:hypothetical protein BD413DRAFT_617852 [Trametes elegans]|nr:hypothetical protein BD413DRAFT_617852 [Trametes elegans]